MDQRIESFLADILALADEDPDAVHEGVSASSLHLFDHLVAACQ
jgi:hypothetical protein